MDFLSEMLIAPEITFQDNETLLLHHCSGDKIKKNEMAGACSTYGERRSVYRVFWKGNLRERDHLEDRGVDGRIIVRWIFRK